jgi:transposase
MLEIASQTGIYDSLVGVFGEGTADALISLAIMRVIRPGPLRQISDQIDETYLPEMLSLGHELTSQYLSTLLSKTGRDMERRRRFCSSLVSGEDAVVFDLTSFHSSSKLLGMLEYGRDYRSTGLPQVNFGLVHSLTSGLPFHYKLFPGSVSDIVTLRNLVAELKDMGIKRTEFVLDRGFYSASNICGLFDEGMGFTVPMPFNLKEAKMLMSESVKPLEDTTNAHVFNGSVYRVNETSSFIGEHSVRTIVYQDDDRRNQEIKTLFSRLDAFEKRMKNTKWHPNIIKELAKSGDRDLLKMFEMSRGDEGTVAVARRRNSVSAAENRCGKLILLTTSRRSWDELLAVYRKRNDIEADFSMLKSDLEGGVRYLSSNDSMEGMIFVEFLSLVLRTELLNRVRTADLADIWVPDIVNTMNKLKITLVGSRWRLNEVTKKQRELYRKLGVSPPDLVIN